MSPSDVRAYFDRYTYNIGFRGTQSIDQAYGRYSSKKASLWAQIKDFCTKDNGHYLTVISHNGWYFTAGYLFKKDNDIYFRCFIPTDWHGIMKLSYNDMFELKRQGIIIE